MSKDYITPREALRWYLGLCVALFLAFAVVCYVVATEQRAHAATTAAPFRHEVGISGQVITNPVAPTLLSVPDGAQHAWIHVKDAPACYSYGPTAPTATSGGEWPVGFTSKIQNDRQMLQALRFINCAEGATTVKVYYTRDRRANEP